MTKDGKQFRHHRETKRKGRMKQGVAWGAFVAVLLAVGAFGVSTIHSKEEAIAREEAEKAAVEKEQRERVHQEKRLKKAKNTIDEYYAAFLSESGGSIPVSAGDKKEFSDWLFDNYSNDMTEKVLASVGDGTLTDEELYNAVGESKYVLSDRYQGLLKDSQTAGQYGIYEREGKAEKQAEITIAGDLCFAEDGFVLDHYDTVNDLEQCISPEILDITNQSDIFFMNHEYAISDRGTPLNGKYYTFRAKPERMDLLKQMGTDLASLANNHVFDYGEEAMLDTTELLNQAEIPYVGGGKNIEEAKRPVYFIINGMKIGFVGASNAEKLRFTPQAGETAPGILLAYDTTEYNQVIADASKQCDYLIAYIHWGTEDTNDFNSKQQAWGREFLKSGADIVVGGHPHVLQGMEYVDGKPIIYSLGDFWFNHETKYTGLLKLNIGFDGLEEMSFVPCLQTNFTTRYLKTVGEQKELFDFLERLSPNIEIDEAGRIMEKEQLE